MNLKDALKELRQRSGLSQDDVAFALNIRQSTVAMWESGVNMPRAALLPKLAELYHCSIDDLYDRRMSNDPEGN